MNQQQLLLDIADFLTVQLKGELKSQGHNFTGSLSKSIEYEIQKKVNSVNIKYYLLQYGLALNTGVKPSKIPYSPGSGAKRSKYIEGLKKWVRGKFGYSRQRAERVAFAIASKQKKEGSPLTGKIGWINMAIEDSKQEIENKIQIWVLAQIEDLINQFINGQTKI